MPQERYRESSEKVQKKLRVGKYYLLMVVALGILSLKGGWDWFRHCAGMVEKDGGVNQGYAKQKNHQGE